MGAAVNVRRMVRALAAALCLCTAQLADAAAGERYALVVTGASGGAPYADQYEDWRRKFVDILENTFHYPRDHVTVLAEKESDGVAQATRENVRRAVDTLRRVVTKDDVVLFLLLGHGTSGNDEARFNLVGPD